MDSRSQGSARNQNVASMLEDRSDFNTLLGFIREPKLDTDLFRQVQQSVSGKPHLMDMVDDRCLNPLHVGLLCGAPLDKIDFLLSVSPRLATEPCGRKPLLHQAFETNPKPAVICRLIATNPRLAEEIDHDGNGRLPLHVVLDVKPFSKEHVQLARELLAAYPEAAAVHSPDDALPLHTALRESMDVDVLGDILHANYNAARIRGKDRKLPLHIAIEKSIVSLTFLETLLLAHPAALLEHMPVPGYTSMTVLEFAIRHKMPQSVKQVLINGAETHCALNPRFLAYAEAAATGNITVVLPHGVHVEEEDDNDASFVPKPQEKEERSSQTGGKSVRLNMCMWAGKSFHLQMKDTALVGDLMQKIESITGLEQEIQKLTINGVNMVDDCDLRFYNIGTEERIHVQPRYDLFQIALQNRETEEDDPVILELLRVRPSSASDSNEQGNFPLVFALQHRAGLDVIEAIVEAYPRACRSPVLGGPFGEYALHTAMRHDHGPNVVKLLLSHIRVQDWNDSGCLQPGLQWMAWGSAEEAGMPPLHLAITRGYGTDIISLLLDSKAPVAARYHGLTALEKLLSCPEHCELSTFHLLLARSAAEAASMPELAKDWQQLQALFERLLTDAVVANPVADVEALEEMELDRDDADWQATDRPSIHDSSLVDRSTNELVKFKQAVRSVLLTPGGTGCLPIHVAVSNGASDGVILQLCDLVPEALRVTDHDGRLPIHFAAMRRLDHVCMRHLLTAWPGSAHEKNGQGLTAVQMAVLNRPLAGVLFEFSRNAPGCLDVRDTKGRSLMEFASWADAPPQTIQELIDEMPNALDNFNFLDGKFPATQATVAALRAHMADGGFDQSFGLVAAPTELGTDHAASAAKAGRQTRHKRSSASNFACSGLHSQRFVRNRSINLSCMLVGQQSRTGSAVEVEASSDSDTGSVVSDFPQEEVSDAALCSRWMELGLVRL